jgi:hypothetical protein
MSSKSGSTGSGGDASSRNRDPGCRLFGLVSQTASIAVILRRGPTRWTRMSLWNLEDDTLEHGQWLRARVHEHRCDLSPDGRLIVYFAADYGRPMQTWTAVSRPPHLTALALWPNGDSWGGGGVFYGGSELWLNHPRLDHDPAKPPRGLQVSCNGGGAGEAYPIFGKRLHRDGWQLRAESKPLRATSCYTWQRRSPLCGTELVMSSYATSNEKFSAGRGCYFEEYALLRPDGETIDLPGTEWADWDGGGRLLTAKHGSLFVTGDNQLERLVEDLSSHRPTAIAPPLDALEWPP